MLLSEEIHLSTDMSRLYTELLSHLDVTLTKRYNSTKHLDYADESDISTVFHTWVKPAVENFLNKYTKSIAVNHHKRLKGTKTSFIPMESGSAEYDNETNEIHIKRAYAAKLTRGICARMDQLQEQGLEKVLNVRIGASTVATSTLKTIVSLFAHEVTHAIQYSRSTKDDPYRSYTMRDQEAFHDKLEQGILDLDYYASPEEIDGYAHGDAMDTILAIDKNLPIQTQITNLRQKLKTITSTGTKYAEFRSTPGQLNQRIVNRYLKKLYQEIDRHIGNMEKTANQT